jgi:hypothetical protein
MRMAGVAKRRATPGVHGAIRTASSPTAKRVDCLPRSRTTKTATPYPPTPTHSRYTNLLSDIEKGDIKIPQFQRDFVWSIQKSAEE